MKRLMSLGRLAGCCLDHYAINWGFRAWLCRGCSSPSGFSVMGLTGSKCAPGSLLLLAGAIPVGYSWTDFPGRAGGWRGVFVMCRNAGRNSQKVAFDFFLVLEFDHFWDHFEIFFYHFGSDFTWFMPFSIARNMFFPPCPRLLCCMDPWPCPSKPSCPNLPPGLCNHHCWRCSG